MLVSGVRQEGCAASASQQTSYAQAPHAQGLADLSERCCGFQLEDAGPEVDDVLARVIQDHGRGRTLVMRDERPQCFQSVIDAIASPLLRCIATDVSKICQ